MVLSYWGREIPYNSLLRLLRVQPYGAPAGNRGDFELAWLERDYAFALIKPT